MDHNRLHDKAHLAWAVANGDAAQHNMGFCVPSAESIPGAGGSNLDPKSDPPNQVLLHILSTALSNDAAAGSMPSTTPWPRFLCHTIGMPCWAVKSNANFADIFVKSLFTKLCLKSHAHAGCTILNQCSAKVFTWRSYHAAAVGFPSDFGPKKGRKNAVCAATVCTGKQPHWSHWKFWKLAMKRQ